MSATLELESYLLPKQRVAQVEEAYVDRVAVEWLKPALWRLPRLWSVQTRNVLECPVFHRNWRETCGTQWNMWGDVLYAFLENYSDILLAVLMISAEMPRCNTRSTRVMPALSDSESGEFPQPVDKKSLNCYRTCATRGSFNHQRVPGLP